MCRKGQLALRLDDGDEPQCLHRKILIVVSSSDVKQIFFYGESNNAQDIRFYFCSHFTLSGVSKFKVDIKACLVVNLNTHTRLYSDVSAESVCLCVFNPGD